MDRNYSHSHADDPQKTTIRAALKEAPPLLTKQWLCARFGLFGSSRYRDLRKVVITDAVLQQLDLTPDQYADIRGRFTRELSVRLIEILQLRSSI